MNQEAIEKTFATARQHLLDLRVTQGYWQGELSSSSLSTATAICALSFFDADKHKDMIDKSLNWLSQNQNTDGGFGDTTNSPSNISTTMLCLSAFDMCRDRQQFSREIENAEKWITAFAGSLAPDAMIAAINKKYGKDRTFAVPILSVCALAGRLSSDKNIWRSIYALPFELAACPHRLFKLLRLPVVSYALPAIIALGHLHFHKAPPRNPVTRLLRLLTRRRTLKVLAQIQPDNGGFLEAAPLTAFVVIALINSGHRENIVAQKGVDFLTSSVRPDGSWPVDTNLATWLTTLSVNALGDDLHLSPQEVQATTKFLLTQQHTVEHPYTHAAPGGWAWTDLPGAVPDADDTAGALIALIHLTTDRTNPINAAVSAIQWLIDMQNRDGGIPTFCRGWTNLPFDRSCPDITAHAVDAWTRWYPDLDTPLRQRLNSAIRKAVAYLAEIQTNDGSWVPLWFGNQFTTDQQNPVYGTSRVLSALASVPLKFLRGISNSLQNATAWLIAGQNSDNGWGNATAQNSSVEETALAIDALSAIMLRHLNDPEFAQVFSLDTAQIETAIHNGTKFLTAKLDTPGSIRPSPIGLYFASLWYHQELYPWIFSVSALKKVCRLNAAMKDDHPG